ncbi:MAG: FAD-binding protein [Chloroflexi bacterium]|nr:FAD-binding protein [Chloroflexota bacterium]
MEKSGNVIDSDILVIGGGIGGHVFAITAKEKSPGLEVAVVEKAAAGKTGPSALVGGRYGAFLPETDDFDGYFKAEVEEQDYLCDQEKIEDHLNNSGPVFRNLERWGVKFVRDRKGEYERPLSRGYHGGTLLDGGGIPAMQALNNFARKIGVRFYDRIMVTDLMASAGRVNGVVGFGVRGGEVYVFRSKITALATGMTRFKTIQPGHRNDTGDGYAMAYRAGAELGGFDSTHHNTYGARQEVGPGNNLYVGLGGYFLNARGERFMHKYHPELAERAPFVWLSPSFCIERMEGRAPPIYLDMRHFTPEKIQALWKSVPYAMIRYERAGILKGDRFVQPVEYTPEGPRPMPCGVITTRDYQSRGLAGLFAVGDASAQKGAGGLSGAAVSSAIAGACAAGLAPSISRPEIDVARVENLVRPAMAPLNREDGIEPAHVILAIQEAIHPYYVGIIRSETRLAQALKEIEYIRDHEVPLMKAYDPHYLMLAHEASNMALCAEMFLSSALARKESRLGRLREDYRELDNINWFKYIHLKQDRGKMNVWAEEVPSERYRLQPKRERLLHPFWQRVEALGYKTKVEDGASDSRSRGRP